jgi:hypothetical protein
MEDLEKLTLSEMREFLESNGGVKMGNSEQGGGYELIERVLRTQGYRRLKKSRKGTSGGYWRSSADSAGRNSRS